MLDDINAILKKLGLKDTGVYKDNFYILSLADSNAYAKMYTLLDEKTENIEYPYFNFNTNKNATGVTNYFKLEINKNNYLLFLIADFENDQYKLKITEDTDPTGSDLIADQERNESDEK